LGQSSQSIVMVAILLSSNSNLGTGHSSSLFHSISVAAASPEKVEPAEGQRAIHVLYMMHSAVGNLLVFMQVSGDNLAMGAVAVHGENGFCFQLTLYDKTMEQREWLLRRSEHSSKQSIWGLLTCSNTARYWAYFLII